MEEKRKSKRYTAKLDLNVSSLFKQDNVKVENINAPITVVDISRGGIGFHSKAVLPLGYYFNASIQINNKEDSTLYCVVKIIRASDMGNGMTGYGCEFIGLAPVLSYLFEELEAQAEEESSSV